MGNSVARTDGFDLYAELDDDAQKLVVVVDEDHRMASTQA